MAIPAISAAMPSLPTLPSIPTPGVSAPGGPGGVGVTGGSAPGKDFGNVFVDAMERLDQAHNQADKLATQAATGDLQDAHDYMIAATEASLATEMTMAVRNKAVEAFTTIMQMPV